jgi:short-subunit dehydrogenase
MSADPNAARKNVVITGASSGIGLATAKLLHEKGYRVIGTSRHPELSETNGIEMLQLEVTSEDSVSQFAGSVLKRTNGQVDVLINNVGTGILGAAEESSVDQVKTLFDINYFGSLRVTNALLPSMRKNKSGKILFMSSVGGISSIPFASYYCATKHAIEAYVESLRLEIEQFGISAVIIAPGTVSTPAGDKAMQPDRPIGEYVEQRKRYAEKFVEAIRSGMDPKEVAKAIFEVIETKSPSSRYTVGGQSKLVTFLKSTMPSGLFEMGVKQAVKP